MFKLSLKGALGLLLILSSAQTFSSVITNFDETKIQAPFKDSNEEPLLSTICRTRENAPWDYCSSVYEDGSEQMKNFKFMNWGDNDTVPQTGFGVGRSFEFQFEGMARSDLGLLIWDSPDEVESHGHLKLMMFFPRLVLPAIRYEVDANKDQMVVTLPTKEEVIFNAKTKEVIGGALKESPIGQDQNGAALNPAVQYSGTGVVVEADSVNDYPVGLASDQSRYATVKKKGQKDCRIKISDLWYTDEKKGGNVFFNKKYVTDQAFDKLLKRKCGFSIF